MSSGQTKTNLFGFVCLLDRLSCMTNRALREVFSNAANFVEGTWRGIFESSESNFLAIAGISVYCTIKILKKMVAYIHIL